MGSEMCIRDSIKKFLLSIKICEDLWGDHAFQRFDSSSNSWRSQMMLALYDAQMISAYEFSKNKKEVRVDKGKLNELTKKSFLDEEFESSVRSNTNTPKKVKYRINKMLHILEESAL